MLENFRGTDTINCITNFKSNWSKNQLKLDVVIDQLPNDFDLEFIDQVITKRNLVVIPKYFHKIQENIYQKKLVTTILIGGLGNRLFQICIALYYAQLYHKTAVIALNHDKSNAHSKINYRDTIFKHFPRISQFPNNHIRYKENPQDFSTFQNWNDTTKHVLFEGYFQSHKYIQPDFFKYFTLPKPVINLVDFAFVHIRRGDYLKLSMYTKLSRLYYLSCMNQLHTKLPKTKLIVMSDDINWCMRQHMFSYIDKFDTDSKNELETLSLMGACQNGAICSNSTFAWWGNWFRLNQENVWMPTKWLEKPWQIQYSISSTNLIVPDPMHFFIKYDKVDDFYYNSNLCFAEIGNITYKQSLYEFLKKNITFDVVCITMPINNNLTIIKNECPKLINTTMECFFESLTDYIVSRTGAKKLLSKSKVKCILLN